MRALILAAGLGTRLHPLTELRPKPAVPVRGIPVVGYLLHWLADQGVREVMINLHYLPAAMREAAERNKPDSLQLSFSQEDTILGTGGGMRRVADFLRESEVSTVLGCDMLLDLDLRALVERHRSRGDRVTLALRNDPRVREFGTIGVDAEGAIRRIGSAFDLGGERAAGVFTSLRLLTASAYDSLPDDEVFEDLRDWLVPELRAGARDIRAECLPATECIWEPVGTLREYLDVNLHPPALSYLSEGEIQAIGGVQLAEELILGAGATMGQGASLKRAVVWDDEEVPGGFSDHDGVYAGGTFHRVDLDAEDDAGAMR